MRLPTPPDYQMMALAKRYVFPDMGKIRRYLKLLHGNFLRLPEPVFLWFAWSLAKDARKITDDELRVLLDSEWRARMTAAWLIGLDRRTQFREQLGTLLLESELVYAGEGYCFALARFGEERDAEILTAYLDRWLPERSCHYNQDDAMGTLLYLDELHATEHAARFLTPGGLWDNSAMAGLDPTEQKGHVELMCEFAENCMSGNLVHWLPKRRLVLDRR
ncbi:hypothetical protein HS041_00960 [Planomonospora sp. ID67723]|uniref:DUF6000 family protein n=1 Tax=Planomonospora sp. ID67723 TaxID=2738134 RepID=UPI0018C355DB|nr:DUF6000 family protein [Planomonospora sp. ID67723]MBG0826352.1 hypothetical protein [Planomonospora sp. ID67723]